MIIQEHFDLNGRDFIRTYSDAGRCVVRDGIEYDEACDPAVCGRQYTEGEPMPDIDDSEALEILLGGHGE